MCLCVAQCPANGLEKENTKCMIGLAALTMLRVKTGLEVDQASNLLTIAHNLGDKDATELIQKMNNIKSGEEGWNILVDTIRSLVDEYIC